ncbi:MAG: hypothetical protein IPN11_00010 [Opitutaceae bacterium]|nr:hypothetical protein [Opitutaceae bacterium]
MDAIEPRITPGATGEMGKKMGKDWPNRFTGGSRGNGGIGSSLRSLLSPVKRIGLLSRL